MAVTLTLLAAERGKGPFIEVEALLTFAGAYVAGGVQLDLTQLYSQTDPAGRNLDSDVRPLWAAVRSKAALAGGVLILRYREPERHRAFRAPGGPLAPILTILTCLLLMAGLPIMNWIRFFVWLAIGLVIYFSYSRKRSTLREESRITER